MTEHFSIGRTFGGVAILFAVAMLFVLVGSCAGGRRQLVSVRPVAVTPPANLPDQQVEQPDEHKLLTVQARRLRVAVWPFDDGSARAKGVFGSGAWMFATAELRSTNEAGIVRATVAKVLSADHLRRYTVLERVHLKPVLGESGRDLAKESPAAAAIKVGNLMRADQIVVGSCLPGAAAGEFFVEIALLDAAGTGERVRTKTGTCSPCTTRSLEALATRLAAELIDPNDLDVVIPGGLPGS